MNNTHFSDSTSIDDFVIEGYYEEKYHTIPSVGYMGSLDNSIETYLYKKYEVLFGYFDYRNQIQKNKETEEEGMFFKSNSATVYFLDEKRKTIIRYTKPQENAVLTLFCSNRGVFKEFAEELSSFKISSNVLRIGFLFESHGNITIRKVALPKIEVDVATNYGEGFVEKHNHILENLKTSRSGLYLFYGQPGTGKTSYIKLLASLVNRLFVFIPTNQIHALVSPSLISLLIDNPNAVLILEDAEQAVVSREDSSDSSLVSTILNLSDGILGTALNTSLIVTFNTNRDKIDEALVRKGRLIAEHDFQALSAQDSKKLAEKLGLECDTNEALPLSEIYNLSKRNFHPKDTNKEKPAIGFGG